MSTNHYFQSGIPGGRSSEQLLMEDLVIECLKIYGFDVYYMPRQTVNEDVILNEDVTNKFDFAYPLEMYLSNTMGFEGEGDLLTKFGVEFRDTATFIVSRRRWDEVVARTGTAQLSTRPAEGDVLYFPLTKAFFEIMRVDATDPFFQVGKLYVYKLECELLRYSSERFNTGVGEIDTITGDKSTDINDFNLLTEDGDRLMYEYFAESFMITEEYSLRKILPNTSNEDFKDNIDILDFTERDRKSVV